MRLSIKGTTVAAALLWGGAILLVELINLARPTYGATFLTMVGSVYPWFHSSGKIANIVIGAVDGLVDGAIAGCVFGLLYNALLCLSDVQTLQGRHT